MSPTPDRCLWRRLCLLLGAAVLVGGSTPAPEEEAWSPTEEPMGSTVQLQPDLQTEVQTQPTEAPAPGTSSEPTGQSGGPGRVPLERFKSRFLKVQRFPVPLE
ncbi:unnamed protein product [Tetraodon nigroviridis]|uniref:(spotted green pufferfish) hypothetical protein n=1 Tax=Tetraodon nigroviridis TaxID=99883 RepID=Q4T0N3_TETNG|nr:unnamed protein product [Tetraodon nigroviridis]